MEKSHNYVYTRLTQFSLTLDKKMKFFLKSLRDNYGFLMELLTTE